MATKQLDTKSSGHGGKRAGAGRPQGSVGELKRRLRALADENLDELMRAVLAIAQDEEQPGTTRLSAIELLLNRAYGRPAVEAPEQAANAPLSEELAAALRE